MLMKHCPEELPRHLIPVVLLLMVHCNCTDFGRPLALLNLSEMHMETSDPEQNFFPPEVYSKVQKRLR